MVGAGGISQFAIGIIFGGALYELTTNRYLGKAKITPEFFFCAQRHAQHRESAPKQRAYNKSKSESTFVSFPPVSEEG